MTTIPPDYEDADPGLARVRTSLAWTRTALSFAAVGAVALRKDVTRRNRKDMGNSVRIVGQ